MRVSIRGRGALSAVSPTALSAYARAAGWRRHEPYREYSDVYVGESRPEIIVPRTERLGDYASVVATLIDTFAGITGKDQLSVYRSLATADRDVVRVRAAESDDGSVTLNDGVDLIGGARDLLLSAACSLREPQPVYRAGANCARPWSGSSNRSRPWTWASRGLGLGRLRQRESSLVSAGRMRPFCARRPARSASGRPDRRCVSTASCGS